MSTAVVDTTVLYAAANGNAHRHGKAFDIVRSADSGDLPALRVPDAILVETMSGVARDVGHDTATEVLTRLRAGTQFEVVREPTGVWSTGLDVFERVERLSLADALVVASVRHHDLPYLYSFDDDFDGLDGVKRLSTPDNPYTPD